MVPLACCLVAAVTNGVAGSNLVQRALVGALQSVVDSPLYRQVVVPQARATMVRTAEANGIDWGGALDWIRAQGFDEAEVDSLARGVEVPAYYRAPFHAYDEGNLCFEAAWEQEIASAAVGARNFPLAPDGEEAFRTSFDEALASIGATCPEGGVLVDVGCGTGTSTRRLARQFPRAASVLGLDLSPHMVAVGRRLLQLAPADRTRGEWITRVEHDARISLEVRDAARTQLADESVDVVALTLVIHELPPAEIGRACREALRVLRPGGQLWVCEMDFETDGYVKLRANPLLFSLIRSTEPYLDEYAEYHPKLASELADMGFGSVRLVAATGRHFALVATKRRAGEEGLEAVVDDRRAETAKADTHLQTWEARRQPDDPQ